MPRRPPPRHVTTTGPGARQAAEKAKQEPDSELAVPFTRATWGTDADGWDKFEIDLSSEVPTDVHNLDDIARWVATRVPTAIGFMVHPSFSADDCRYVTAPTGEGSHGDPGSSWPVYLLRTWHYRPELINDRLSWPDVPFGLLVVCFGLALGRLARHARHRPPLLFRRSSGQCAVAANRHHRLRLGGL